MFTWTRTDKTPGGPPASAPRSVPQSATPAVAPPPIVAAPEPPDASPQTRRFTDSAPCATRLGRLQIRGTLTGSDSVEIGGTVDGPVTVEGTCHVLEGGRVNGTITATDVVIAGEVDGHVTARGRLEMAAHARVLADVVATTVAIAEGCFIEGRIHMRGAHDTDRPTAFKEKRKGKRKGNRPDVGSQVPVPGAGPATADPAAPSAAAPTREPAATPEPIAAAEPTTPPEPAAAAPADAPPVIEPVADPPAPAAPHATGPGAS